MAKSRRGSASSGRTSSTERPTRRCGLCGKTRGLTKTECCGNWICDDEDNYVLFSYARNSCYRNHRRFTLCGYHHAEDHAGSWKDCPDCRKDFETELYVHYGTNAYNFERLVNPPAYEPTKCSACGAVIRLGEDGYSQRGNAYWCEACTAEDFGRVGSSLREASEEPDSRLQRTSAGDQDRGGNRPRGRSSVRRSGSRRGGARR